VQHPDRNAQWDVQSKEDDPELILGESSHANLVNEFRGEKFLVLSHFRVPREGARTFESFLDTPGYQKIILKNRIFVLQNGYSGRFPRIREYGATSDHNDHHA
jgi:hypothetical protein